MTSISDDDAQDTPRLIVVGIGASAGGLEALSQLAANLPTEGGFCYVVAQHMAPQHRSMMVDLLARSSRVKVVEATDGAPLDPDIIFITPPNRNVEVQGDRIVLREPYAEGPKPSVDLLFKSLADDVGERAVAVVLSGTGSDGSHGVRAIKSAGGLTIVQDPATAKYASMPEAAVRTGSVDLVLPPDRIGEALLSIATKMPAPHGLPGEASPTAYNSIIDLIRHRSNVDFQHYKPSTILRRLHRRMAARRIESLESYADFLNGQPSEIESLCADILISVTSFFRDGPAFEALDRALGELISRKPSGEAVRVWVPGCATGEEAYSVAMLLAERLRADSVHRPAQIFAVDIDEPALAYARHGFYPAASVDGMNKAFVARYMREADGHYQITKELRDLVIFSRQDITKDPPFSRIDLVSCRNLLIYFNNELQNRVLELFHYALNPGGILFLGKSETVGADGSFETIDRTHKLFRRKPGRRVPLSHMRVGARSPDIAIPPGRTRPEPPPLPILVHRTLSEAYGPPSVVIDEALRVVHVHGEVKPFLEIGQGKFDQDILTLTVPPLRTSLRAALHRASRAGETRTAMDVRYPHEGEVRLVRIALRPINTPDGVSPFRVVSFETIGTGVREEAPVAASPSDDVRAAELEHELTATREHLQTVIQELETANEELQATNEELQSSNEELQATNEELETSNEELQSTNEELETVNDELRAKSAELAQKSADLENVHGSIDFPMILVDRDLRVRLFNAAACRIFSLSAAEPNVLITQVATKLEMPDLRRKILHVIETGEVHHREVVADDDTGHFLKSIVPYRDPDKGIVGAILTLHEITERAHMEERLRTLTRQLNEAQRLSHVGSWQWLISTPALSWSDEVFRIFGREPDSFIPTFDAAIEAAHPEDRDQLRAQFDAAISSGKGFSLKYRVPRPNGEMRHVQIEATCEHGSSGQVKSLFGVIRDITDQVQAAQSLVENHARLNTIMNTVVEGIVVIDTKGIIRLANHALAQMFGYAPEELVGNNVSMLMTDAEHRRHDVYLENYLRTGQKKIIGVGREVTGRRRDGSTFPLELSVGEVHDELATGDPNSSHVFIGTLRDISARKVYEEALVSAKRSAEAANEAKTIFLAQMSHELRTPLNAIIGFSEIIKEEMLGTVHPPKYKQYAADIHSSGQHLLAIISDILDISRIEAGKLKIEDEIIELGEVVAKCVNLVKDQARNKSILVSIDVPPDLPRLRADGRALRQILINLLSNAIKFTPDRGAVSVGARSAKDGGLILSVGDTGIGMSGGEIRLALEPFGRGESDKARKHEGTGLGLVISKSLVEMHGGRLEIDSQVDKGTTVTLHFPPSRVTSDSRHPRRAGAML